MEVAEHRVERRNKGDSCADEVLGTSGLTEKNQTKKQNKKKNKTKPNHNKREEKGAEEEANCRLVVCAVPVWTVCPRQEAGLMTRSWLQLWHVRSCFPERCSWDGVVCLAAIPSPGAQETPALPWGGRLWGSTALKSLSKMSGFSALFGSWGSVRSRPLWLPFSADSSIPLDKTQCSGTEVKLKWPLCCRLALGLVHSVTAIRVLLIFLIHLCLMDWWIILVLRDVFLDLMDYFGFLPEETHIKDSFWSASPVGW